MRNIRIAVCLMVGVLLAFNSGAQATVTFGTGNAYFSFANGVVTTSNVGADIRFVYTAAVDGPQIITQSFNSTQSYYNLQTNTVTSSFAGSSIRFSESSPSLRLGRLNSFDLNQDTGSTDYANLYTVDPSTITQGFSRTVSSQPSNVFLYKLVSTNQVYKLQVLSYTVTGWGDCSGTLQTAEINVGVPAPATQTLQAQVASGATYSVLTGVTDFSSVTSYDPANVTSTGDEDFSGTSPYDVMIYDDGTDLYKLQLLTMPAGEFATGTFQFAQIQSVPEPATLSLLALGSLALVRRKRRA